MLVIEASDLLKRFGKVQALSGLNLHLNEGVIGLVGPNGSGKTTTIGILLGLLRPDRGKAGVLGFDCWRESFEVRKRVGVLHEKPVYPGGFTGRRYLEHVAEFYGIENSEEKVSSLLIDVGLSEAADRNIGTYSAGMVQRIGLAQALIGEPELVILDEPTANLDPIGRVEFLERIKKLHREQGMSFLISTHILTELETVCDQVAIINQGVVKEQGKIEKLVKKHPATEYVAIVSDPELLGGEIKKASFAKHVRTETGGKVIVETDDQQRFQDEVVRIVRKRNLQLVAMGPQYGVLGAVYRKVMEEKENA